MLKISHLKISVGILVLGILFTEGHTMQPDSQSHTYSYWLSNPRLADSTEAFLYAVETNQYGFLLDVYQGGLRQLGGFHSTVNLKETSEQRMQSLPSIQAYFRIRQGTEVYSLRLRDTTRDDKPTPHWSQLQLIICGCRDHPDE